AAEKMQFGAWKLGSHGRKRRRKRSPSLLRQKTTDAAEAKRLAARRFASIRGNGSLKRRDAVLDDARVELKGGLEKTRQEWRRHDVRRNVMKHILQIALPLTKRRREVSSKNPRRVFRTERLFGVSCPLHREYRHDLVIVVIALHERQPELEKALQNSERPK